MTYGGCICLSTCQEFPRVINGEWNNFVTRSGLLLSRLYLASSSRILLAGHSLSFTRHDGLSYGSSRRSNYSSVGNMQNLPIFHPNEFMRCKWHAIRKYLVSKQACHNIEIDQRHLMNTHIYHCQSESNRLRKPVIRCKVSQLAFSSIITDLFCHSQK